MGVRKCVSFSISDRTTRFVGARTCDTVGDPISQKERGGGFACKIQDIAFYDNILTNWKGHDTSLKKYADWLII